MTLPSRHMIGNSRPGGLKPSTLPLGHGGSPQYWIFTSERGMSNSDANPCVCIKLELLRYQLIVSQNCMRPLSDDLSQHTQNICTTFVKCRPNFIDVGPTLYKCYTNVLCLLGCVSSYRRTWVIPMLWETITLLCKTKRQHLLTFQVSSYCHLALQSSTVSVLNHT